MPNYRDVLSYDSQYLDPYGIVHYVDHGSLNALCERYMAKTPGGAVIRPRWITPRPINCIACIGVAALCDWCGNILTYEGRECHECDWDEFRVAADWAHPDEYFLAGYEIVEAEMDRNIAACKRPPKMWNVSSDYRYVCY